MKRRVPIADNNNEFNQAKTLNEIRTQYEGKPTLQRTAKCAEHMLNALKGDIWPHPMYSLHVIASHYNLGALMAYDDF